MASHRIAQVDALLRRELDWVLRRDVEFPPGCLFTIEEVKTSRDLSHATVAFSVYPFSRREEVLKILQAARIEIQHALVKKVILRTVPKLVFVVDEREERADRINRLLDTPPPPTKIGGGLRRARRGERKYK